jgi:ureidoacrylate peracid hydrolase
MLGGAIPQVDEKDRQMLQARARHLLTTLEDRVKPGHTAVVVVDLQNDYVSEGGVKHRRDGTVTSGQAVLAPTGRLLASARSAGALVIYLKMTLDYPWMHYASDVDLGRRARRYGDEEMVVAGTWGHEIAPEVAPENGDVVIEKQRSSGFVGTNLDMILRSNRIESIVLAGVVTHGCVFATGLSAMMSDYYVTVAEDCVGSPRPDLHDIALKLLVNYLQFEDSVVPSGRIIDAWSGINETSLAPSATEIHR